MKKKNQLAANARKYRNTSRGNDKDQIPLPTLFNKYMHIKEVEGVTEKTLITKRNYFELVYGILHEKHKVTYATDIEPDMLREIIQYLKAEHIRYENNSTVDDALKTKGLKNSTINVCLRHWKAFFTWLFDEDYIIQNPWDKIKTLKDEPNIEGINLDELRKLLNAFNRNKFGEGRGYILTFLLVDTGMRCNEATSLEWSQIDFGSNIITLKANTTKTGKMRFVPFSKNSNALLRKWKEEMATVSERFVFPSIYGDKPVDDREYRKLLSLVSKRAFIKHIHPHMLRHTFATTYLEQGGDVLSLQRILGHSNLAMTSRYVHATTGHITKQQNQFSPINFI